jgi:hypothetical protein
MDIVGALWLCIRTKRNALVEYHGLCTTRTIHGSCRLDRHASFYYTGCGLDIFLILLGGRRNPTRNSEGKGSRILRDVVTAAAGPLT